MKVVAIVVTYERVDFIEELFHSLFKQKPRIYRVIVVDNSRTENILKEIKKIYKIEKKRGKSYKDIEFSHMFLDGRLLYFKTKENIGGAGGFGVGMEIASEFKPDWFWLMDDDVVPMDNALSKMLSYSGKGLCIIPSKVSDDREYLEWWGWLNLKNLREYPIPDENIFGNYALVNTACFEGVLIHSRVVEKIGYPDKEFFIYGDDVVYGFKASKVTRCIHILKPPLFIKKLKKKNFKKVYGKEFPIASRFLSYYLIRNYLLRAKKIKETCPKCVNMVFIFMYHFYYFIKQLLKAIIVEFSFSKVRILVKGFIDSFKFI